jgi:hypothetical protein
MPANRARAFIKITGIRCERLLDISDEDCFAEGIEKVEHGYYKDYVFGKWFDKPKDSFITLYQKANKHTRHTPLINLWVFAYTFVYLKDYKYEQ